MIRKLNIIFVVLVSFLVFYVKFQEFNKNYASDLNNPVTNYVIAHDHTNAVYVTFDLVEVEDKKARILEILNAVDYPAAIDKSERAIEQGYITLRIYVYGPLDKVMYSLDTTTPIHEETNYFITNDTDDLRKTHLIRYLDSKYYNLTTTTTPKVEILPIDTIQDVEDRQYVVFTVHDDEIDYFMEKLNLVLDYKLDENQVRIAKHGEYSRSFEGQTTIFEYFELPKPILYTSTVGLLIILYIQFKRNHKEIAVRRLHGNSSSIVFKRMMLKTILVNVSLFMGVQVLMYLFYVGQFNKISRLFLKTLLPNVLIYLVVLLIFLFSFYAYFYLVMKANSLKSRTQNAITLLLTVVLKVAVVVLLVVPLIETANGYFLKRSNYKAFQKDVINHEKVYIDLFPGNSQHENINVFNYEFIQKNRLGLRDESEYETAQIDFQYMEDTDYNPNIPFLMMNHVSISDYVFKDEMNQEINLDAYRHMNWVLAPISYKDEIEENGIRCFGECTIRYYTNDVFISEGKGFGFIISPFQKNKLIYVMNQYTDEYTYGFGITDTLVDGKMRPELQEAIKELENLMPKYSISIQYGQDALRDQKQAYHDALIMFITQSSLTTLIIFLFTYTYLVIYFDSKGKELAVKYLNGVSFVKRYQLLFYILLSSNTAVYTLLNRLRDINLNAQNQRPNWLPAQGVIISVVALAVFEICVILWLIFVFEKGEIVSVMKGNTDG